MIFIHLGLQNDGWCIAEQTENSDDRSKYIASLGIPKELIHDFLVKKWFGVIWLGGQVLDLLSIDLYAVWTYYLILQTKDESPYPQLDYCPNKANIDNSANWSKHRGQSQLGTVSINLMSFSMNSGQKKNQ